MAEDYFTTFKSEVVRDRDTTILEPFTDGREFVSVTPIRPLPTNRAGDQLVLATGTATQLARLALERGVERVGVAVARTLLVDTTRVRGWATADLPSKWKRKT